MIQKERQQTRMRESTAKKVSSIIDVLSKMDEPTRISMICGLSDGLEKCWKKGLQEGLKALMDELSRNKVLEKIISSGAVSFEDVTSVIGHLSKLRDKIDK